MFSRSTTPARTLQVLHTSIVRGGRSQLVPKYRATYRTPRNHTNQEAFRHYTAAAPSTDRSSHGLVNDAIAALRLAAQNHDIAQAWGHYNFLREKNLAHALGPPLMDAISRMVEGLSASPETEIRSEDGDALKEFALICAAQGRTEGLRSLMVRGLVRNEPQATIQLYESYGSVNTHHLSEPEGLGLGTTLEEGLELEDDKTTLQIRSREAELLVAVIAAHAMQDSFEGALHSTLKQSHLRFGPRDVNRLFKGTPLLDSLLHRQTVEFVEAITPARLTKEIPSLYRHVNRLAREKDTIGLKALSVSILEGYGGKFPWAALSEREVTNSRPLVIPEEVWAIFLKAFMRAGSTKMAEELWSKLSNLSLELGVTTWNGLLAGFRACGDMYRLIQTWDLMREEGIRPNAQSYCIKIGALFVKGRTEDAIADFYRFKTQEQGRGSLQERLTVYNTVLHGLLSKRDAIEGMSMFQEMLKNGPAPDLVTYNTVMGYYGKQNDIRGVANIIGQMQSANIRPDVVSFTTVLSALLRAGVVDATDRVLSIMRKNGIEENVATYSALINHQMREGSVQGFRAAIDLLSRMENTPTIRPNEITYTSILVGIHRCKDLDSDSVISLTRSIIHKLVDRGLALKRGTCQAVLKVFIDNRSPEGLSSAMEFYQYALKRNVIFGDSTWFVLLRGLENRNEWGAAYGVIQDMRNLGHEPSPSLQRVIDRVLRVCSNTRSFSPV